VEPLGAGARDVKTNSGEGSLERCDSKALFQGAGGVVRWVVVPDMVWRKKRSLGVAGEPMVNDRQEKGFEKAVFMQLVSIRLNILMVYLLQRKGIWE